MLRWWGIGLAVILFVSIFTLNYIEQQRATADSKINVRSSSQLIALNSTSVSNDVNILHDTGPCRDLEVNVGVNKHVLYERDKLIIHGDAPLGAKLEGRLIPLDGMTPGKMADVRLKGSYFEYTLHQFGTDDKELKYAAIVNAIREISSGTCLVGDYEIVEYKGARK